LNFFNNLCNQPSQHDDCISLKSQYIRSSVHIVKKKTPTIDIFSTRSIWCFIYIYIYMMEKKTLTIERHAGRANNVAVSEIHDEEKGESGVSSFC